MNWQNNSKLTTCNNTSVNGIYRKSEVYLILNAITFSRQSDHKVGQYTGPAYQLNVAAVTLWE